MSLTCTLKQSDDILDSLRMDGFDQFTLTVFDEEQDIRTMKVCFENGIVKSMIGSRILSVMEAK